MLMTPAGKPRARAIGIPFDGEPGPLNAITDVAGIEVGYRTLIRGAGERVVGQGPVRTGVTAILPRGRAGADQAVFAGMFSLNGNGELTGSHWVAETGRCEGPITLTNTHSIGVAHDAVIRWMTRRFERTGLWSLPVAGETYDGWLNDINGFHVTDADVFAALDGAQAGAIEEGSVGGGTGMICYGFKGGSGTASRRVAFGVTSSHQLWWWPARGRLRVRLVVRTFTSAIRRYEIVGVLEVRGALNATYRLRSFGALAPPTLLERLR